MERLFQKILGVKAVRTKNEPAITFLLQYGLPYSK